MVWMNKGFHEQQDYYLNELKDLEKVRAIFNSLPVGVRTLRAESVDIQTYVGYPVFKYYYNDQETRDERASEAVALLMREGFTFTNDYTLALSSDEEEKERWSRVGEIDLGKMEHLDLGYESIQVQVIISGFSRPVGYQVEKKHYPGHFATVGKCSYKNGGA